MESVTVTVTITIAEIPPPAGSWCGGAAAEGGAGDLQRPINVVVDSAAGVARGGCR